MSEFYHKSMSTPSPSFDGSSGEDALSYRRKMFNSGRSLSMATVQAQVSLAQSLRSLFQAARDPKEAVDSHIEDAWLQAVYNAVVFSMVGVVICIMIAVYFILEPFLYPLLWAVLTGAFLFQFKHSSTARIKQWLVYISDSGVPLAAGLLISPISFVNFVHNKLELTLSTNWKIIGVLVVVTFVVYISFQFSIGTLLYYLSTVVLSGFQYMDLVLAYTQYIQVIVILIGLPLMILYSNSISHSSLHFHALAIFLWYLMFLNLAKVIFGSLGFPIVTILFVLAVLLYAIQAYKKSSEGPSNVEEVKEKISCHPSYHRKSVFSDAYDILQASIVKPGLGMLEQDSSTHLALKKHENVEESEKQENVDEILVDLPPSDDEEKKHEEITHRQSTVRFRTQSMDSAKHEGERVKKLSTQMLSSFDNIYDYDDFQPATDNENASNKAFLVLITVCSLLVVLHHPLLLLLAVPFCLLWCIKQLMRLSIATYCYQIVTLFVSKVYGWCLKHQAKLFPQPLPVLLQICGDIDNLAIVVLQQSVGSLVSAIIIIGLLLGSIGLALFLLFQIQLEISHTIGLLTQVLDSSNSWIYNVLGYKDINNTIHSHFGQFADQGFHYGREWLANKIHHLLNDTAVKEQLLSIYDKMYHAYVFQNSTGNIQQSVGHDTAMEGLQIHIWHQINHVISENLEMIFSVLMSLWSVVSVNISIVATILTSLSSIIFSGGTFFVNFIVYITTLFYLLAYSEDQYLPIKCILSILPSILTESANNNYADTFTRVIQSVIYASLRRACFYGLYTWLILSLFGMEIIILPSAVTGAVPFVGSYWVGLPAILQLWLIEDSLFSALVALGLFILPPFIVDSLINSEIEGSHPYLTGLAIAGGIYFAGLEGALIGPILLCCLLFLVNRFTENL